MSFVEMKVHLSSSVHLQHYVNNIIRFYGHLMVSSIVVMLEAHNELQLIE